MNSAASAIRILPAWLNVIECLATYASADQTIVVIAYRLLLMVVLFEVSGKVCLTSHQFTLLGPTEQGKYPGYAHLFYLIRTDLGNFLACTGGLQWTDVCIVESTAFKCSIHFWQQSNNMVTEHW